MAESTGIEWADATWNPVRGCTRVSPACQNCYAEQLAKRNPATLGTWGPNGTRVVGSEDHWKRPIRWAKKHLRAVLAGQVVARPLRIFTASLGDVFEDHPVVAEVRGRIWTETIPQLEQLRLPDGRPAAVLLLLTKRPRIMADFAADNGWSDVCWAGTTVEDQVRADIRIPALLDVPAPVRFLSMEPLLGPVDLGHWLALPAPSSLLIDDPLAGYLLAEAMREGLADGARSLAWVIVGGESGRNARPMHPGWVRSIREQCADAGVPFLFKQWGEWAPGNLPNGDLTDIDRTKCESGFWAGASFHPGCNPSRVTMDRVGKKAAGRLLDGRTWDEFPGQ